MNWMKIFTEKREGAYCLSDNYLELYDQICKCHIIACFVDHKFSDGDIFRDIAKVKRHEPYRISIGVRGIQYGGVDPYWKDNIHFNEVDILIKECERLNLKWIKP